MDHSLTTYGLCRRCFCVEFYAHADWEAMIRAKGLAKYYEGRLGITQA